MTPVRRRSDPTRTDGDVRSERVHDSARAGTFVTPHVDGAWLAALGGCQCRLRAASISEIFCTRRRLPGMRRNPSAS